MLFASHSAWALAAALAIAPLLACGGDDDDAADTADAAADAVDATPLPFTCDVVPPTDCPAPAMRYADVEPIFQTRCVTCHGTVDDLWPLHSYEHAAAWFIEIRSAMLDCSMPPKDSGLRMPEAEREALLQWIRCGYPQ